MADAALPTPCVLCCEAIDNVSRFHTVGVCNHSGCCSICALRLRQLLGQTTCVMCKTEMPRVICVLHEDETFDSFQNWGDNIGPTHVYDEPSGIFFLKDDYAKHIHKLRDPICKKCGKKFTTVAALRTHVLDVHGLQYCNICLENKKAFLEELALYTKDELKRHHTKGQSNEGFLGHPRCDFCFSRFYSTTELYDHLRKNHFECDICLYHLQIQNRYYKNYNDLENHFRAEHYLCEEPACLAKKFVVFKSHLDLHAHLRRDHPHLKTSSKLDVHFTVRRASPNHENETFDNPRMAPAPGASTINVADFPSLSGSDTATAGPSFSLWESQTVAPRPTAEDFPALASSSSSSNRTHETFRNALAPPPSAALRAHLDTNGWTYESPEVASAAAVLGANNPLLGVLKPARKHTKGRKKGRKTNAEVEEKRSVGEDASESEENEVGDTQSTPCKSALVLKIRQVLGSDAKYEVFREECKRFRLGQVTIPGFYAKLRDMFSLTDFVELVLPLIRLSPDKDQVEAFCTYHNQRTKQDAQGQNTTLQRKNPTVKNATKHESTELEQKPPNRRKDTPVTQSGWGKALKESGVPPGRGRHPMAIVNNPNVQTMRDPPRSTQWSSSTSWQTAASPASSRLEPAAPVNAFTNLHVSSSPSGAAALVSSKPVAASGFQSSTTDFPELPKAANPIGVQPVTRATWDDQVQMIAQHRNTTTDSRKKKPKKKKSMSLQDMAMHFS